MNILPKRNGKERARSSAFDLLKYIGPGLLVTIGFIDPGNWATNLAAGSEYGYALLWVVTLSSVMLIIIQHNVAHLGIVTGLCLSEATTQYIPKPLSRPIIISAIFASISTSLAEILGGAIALQMLFDIPLKIGAAFVMIACVILLMSNTYKRIERGIIFFISIIGLSFLYELWLVDVDWVQTLKCSVTPQFPRNSMLIIMGVLGAVVMPHNLFLHSEIIQSREWNLEDESTKRSKLKYEFYDTLFSMIVGWAINSAMIILAAATFYKHQVKVDELSQAQQLLTPLVGNNAGVVFGVALLLAGIASTITSGIAGASIFAGLFGETYNYKAKRSKLGVLLSFIPATLIIFLISDPFKGLIYSQVVLSIQLPITIFTQVYLTSNKAVMGTYANTRFTTGLLLVLGLIVTALNFALLISLI
ncbi:MAG: Nramp family divalent metal transporter [Tannerellaceae bacterium]